MNQTGISKVSMVDVQAWHQPIQEQLEKKALEILRSGRFIMGQEVEAFEQEAADYLGARYAVSCANGTDALVLALRAAGIGPGDGVLTTGFTFFATAEAIMQVGATPVLVDIDPGTFNIDPLALEHSITSRCKAVLVVHLFGLPAALSEIRAVCDRHGLILLEDCAQSFGASYGPRKTGNYGLMGTFSFYPSKNLGGFGDGGLVITSDPALAETVRMLGNHGSTHQYCHECPGYNSRLDEIQAGLLRIKLQYIEEFNNDRKKIAAWYRAFLQNTEVLCPEQREEHIYHQFTVVLPFDRDAIRKRLDGKGIASAVYYPLPLHKQKALAGLASEYQLPVCEQLSEHCLSLPAYPGMTRDLVARVCDELINAM